MAKKQQRKRKHVTHRAESGAVAAASLPLIFISHDERDAPLAEAFEKLLRAISSGMLQTFRSSDKSGERGLTYGARWREDIMYRLQTCSDIVCLLTKKSFQRPWLLFEAGVVAGRPGEIPVRGLVIGMPLKTTSDGPFGTFQNCAADRDSITGLVMQLTQRVVGLSPVKDDVERHVGAFLDAIKAELSADATEPADPQEDAVAKMFEEIKAMFAQLQNTLVHRSLRPPAIESGRSGRSPFPVLKKESVSNDVDLGVLLGRATGKEGGVAEWDALETRLRAVSPRAADGLRRLRTGSRVGVVHLRNGLHELAMDGRLSPGMVKVIDHSIRRRWLTESSDLAD